MLESDTMTFKAIIKPEKIKYHDLPGAMVRINIGPATYWLTPEQATNAAIKLLNLAAVARAADERNEAQEVRNMLTPHLREPT